ncbi:hypothetical protein [Desulfopila sp. IMCC35008]|uniref:hypothetical protein n=1 Tax=Desulfopila sp. IMCC35008 TaxID=2653858 RepID=UPI0013CFD212|nr:hypothetical protein [Desulfopila sp. IMCC35008]
MSNITNQLPQMGLSPRHNSQPDTLSSAIVREQSVKYNENLDTDLVLETREGDKVTLSANSYSRMDAYLYDSKGMVQNETGTALYSESIREITLASGQSFSFTVEGNLNEDELADIESLLQGLDGVIHEMKQGDMFGALDEAMEMGGYESVASFEANISYQQSYQMSSAVAATTTQTLPAQGDGGKPANDVDKSAPGNHNKKFLADFDKFFEKLVKQFDNHDDKIVGLAKDPINKLFGHHLGKKDDDDSASSIYQVLEEAMEKIDTLIDEKVNTIEQEQVEVPDE